MLDKAYDPKPVEEKRLRVWRERQEMGGGVTPNPYPPSPLSRPFTMVIPPPNVTGALHLGHALNVSIQDVLARWAELNGREILWVPGEDHGGIATQHVMEKRIKEEGLSRLEMGREAFVERLKSWTSECRSVIRGQIERLGGRLDWSREAFTMDAARGRAVFAAFKSLWEKGLIYRGERMVNWCVRCRTALSDIEVEREERRGKLWHIRYPEAGGSSGLIVATTRPETMLGDEAVAVHPEDGRYGGLVGRELDLPLAGRRIRVIADSAVDPAFGTGAVKVTPAHDPNDFEMGLRHGLSLRRVIGPEGKMTLEAGEHFAGLSREEARDRVLEALAEGGFLVKAEDHANAVGVCYRCGAAIEPLVSEQWFLKMEELSKPAIQALEERKFKIEPSNWEKPYLEWLKNLKDWCLSRQIWWGHRVPVWYCRHCVRPAREGELNRIQGEVDPNRSRFGVEVSQERPGPCKNCGKSDWEQDPDVLDTWFSSALWPFSVFGWPDKTEDLERFYPTDVLVTGYEILYLWVARMQMMGLEFTGQAPFHTALIHGIVRDKRGKKMSKSLGNVVDPLEMIGKYGADALRFALLSQAYPGRDIPFAETSITGPRNFANKIWNSARFVLMNIGAFKGMGEESSSKETPSLTPNPYPLSPPLELADRWILSRWESAREEFGRRMEKLELASAADVLYGFLWDEFCDWYLEISKIRLQGAEPGPKKTALSVLTAVLTQALAHLSPFMPFITEELLEAFEGMGGGGWGMGKDASSKRTPSLTPNPYPLSPDSDVVGKMERIISAVKAVRSLRSTLGVPPGRKIRVLADCEDAKLGALIKERSDYLKFLAGIEDVSLVAPGTPKPPRSATAAVAGAKFHVPLEGLIDIAKERERLEREVEKARAFSQKAAAKALNKDFLARAPQAEKESARRAHEEALAKERGLAETLSALE